MPDLVDDYLELIKGPRVEMTCDGDVYSGEYYFGTHDG
jgi:hypothetical protein